MSKPRDRYQDGGDLVMRHQGRWHLWRDLAPHDDDDDWVCWQVSVPDTGQGGQAALAELREGQR